MTTRKRQDRLEATVRAVVLCYALVIQTFMAGYFSGASAAVAPDLLVRLGQIICSPTSGGADGGAPATSSDHVACLAACLAAAAAAGPDLPDTLGAPTFVAMADISLPRGDGPVRRLDPGRGPGARAPPSPAA